MYFRLRASETVQFFQFDSDGNMFVFPAGSGCTGVPRLVQPGEQYIFGGQSVQSEENLFQSSGLSVIGLETKANSVDDGIVSSSVMLPSGERGFKIPLKNEILEELSHKNFAPETVQKINWAIKMYRDWRNYRHSHGYEQIECDLDDKSTITHPNLIFALVRFITEVKKVDGSDYPGKTLYDILICVQFHLESLGINWKLLSEEIFADVKYTLDNLMKLRTSEGLGTSVKKAEVLSASDEDYLWSIGLLGTSNPEQLLNTLVVMIGKGFALRAGKEHRALRAPPFNSQFRFLGDDEGKPFIRYVEDIGLKTNKGGIRQRNLQPKEVDVFSIENEERCPVSIIHRYLALLPFNRNCSSFYLQPKKKFTADCWYLDRPAGENRLRDTVKELCKSAKLPGFYTNHSLRSTACTKMYQNDVDEQVIQEISGHRSLAVRSYKRTSQSQCKKACKIIFSK